MAGEKATELMDANAPKCHRCRHYYVTHDPKQPHGCRAYAFKSRQSPAQLVQASSGKPCLLFSPKS